MTTIRRHLRRRAVGLWRLQLPLVALWVSAWTASACGTDDAEVVVGEDANLGSGDVSAGTDAGEVGTAPADSGAGANTKDDIQVDFQDSLLGELSVADAGPGDAIAEVQTGTDASAPDALSVDSATADAAGSDSLSVDLLEGDAGVVDLISVDADATDAATVDVLPTDPLDAVPGPVDADSQDLAIADAAFADLDASEVVGLDGMVDSSSDSEADAADPGTDAPTDALGNGDAAPEVGVPADVVNPNICPYGLSPAFFCLKWGACSKGVALKCIGNSPVCDYSAVPGFEAVEATCDGFDNDCNSLTDDDLVAPPTPKQLGVCAPLTSACLGAAGWGAPDPAKLPAYQTQESACDGLDNDCDGQTDEMAPAAALLQAGVCAGAQQSCQGSQGWQEPDYEKLLNYTADIDGGCDGLDNDCDGKNDEDAVCPLWQLGGRGSGKVALSPDASQLAWVSMTGVHAVDPASGKRYYDHFGHRWEVTAVAYSPDGNSLASVGRNDVLRVYPAAYGLGPPTSWPVTAAVVKGGARWTALAFSVNGSAVVAGDDAGALWPVPLAVGTAQKPWQTHNKAVTALTFVAIAQGQLQLVVSAAADGTVVARPWPGGVPWQVATLGSVVATLHGDGAGRVLVVAPGIAARILDVASGKTAAILTGSEKAVAGRFAPGGSQAWTVDATGQLRRWLVPEPGGLSNPAKGIAVAEQVAGPVLQTGDSVVDLAVGVTRLVVGAIASGPRILHLPNLAWSEPHGTGNTALPKLVVHPAGLVVGASQDGQLRVWDSKTVALLHQFAAHEGAVLALTRGPGWLLSGGSDFAVRLWQWPDNASAGKLAPLNSKTFGLSGPWAADLALAAGGASAWAAAGPGAQRVGTVGGAVGLKIQAYSAGVGAQVQKVAPSPEGGALLLALDGLGPAQGDHYRLLQADTFKILWTRSDLPAEVHAAAWHPSGKWLALGATDAVHLVDASTGLTTALLPGWFGQAAELAWNAQGNRLLGASSDGSARVWSTVDGATAKLVALWARHCPAPCSAVSLRSATWLGDPAGAIATAGDDGSLMAWRAP